MASRNIDVNLRANVGNFVSQFNSAKKTFGGFVSAVQVGIGALGVQRIAQGFLEIVNSVDELATSALKLGTSARSLDAMRYASTQLDVEFRTLESSAVKLRKNLFEASMGVKEQAEAFQKLNLDIKSLSLDPLNVQLSKTFAALSRVGNVTEQTALAMRVFGRSGAELLPIIKSGSTAFEKFNSEALRLNEHLADTSGAEKADEAVKRLTYAWDKFKESLAATGPIREAIDNLNHLLELLNEATGNKKPTGAASNNAALNLASKIGDLKQQRSDILNAGVVVPTRITSREGYDDYVAAIMAKRREQVAALDMEIQKLEASLNAITAANRRAADSATFQEKWLESLRNDFKGTSGAHAISDIFFKSIPEGLEAMKRAARIAFEDLARQADIAAIRAQAAFREAESASAARIHSARIDRLEDLRSRFNISVGQVDSPAGLLKGSVSDFSDRAGGVRDRIQERIESETKKQSKTLDDLLIEAKRSASAAERLEDAWSNIVTTN